MGARESGRKRFAILNCMFFNVNSIAYGYKLVNAWGLRGQPGHGTFNLFLAVIITAWLVGTFATMNFSGAFFREIESKNERLLASGLWDIHEKFCGFC